MTCRMESDQTRTLHASEPNAASSPADAGDPGSAKVVVATILDRSERGCAWYGAPDGVIYGALALGACLQVAALLMFSVRGTPLDALLPTADLPTQPLARLATAFVMLSIAPVFEECLLRGALFAALRRTLSTLGAAVASTAAGVVLHAALYPASRPGALLLVGVLGAAAMALRIRHRALAPAIALNLGATVVALCCSALD